MTRVKLGNRQQRVLEHLDAGWTLWLGPGAWQLHSPVGDEPVRRESVPAEVINSLFKAKLIVPNERGWPVLSGKRWQSGYYDTGDVSHLVAPSYAGDNVRIEPKDAHPDDVMTVIEGSVEALRDDPRHLRIRLDKTAGELVLEREKFRIRGDILTAAIEQRDAVTAERDEALMMVRRAYHVLRGSTVVAMRPKTADGAQGPWNVCRLCKMRTAVESGTMFMRHRRNCLISELGRACGELRAVEDPK